MGRICDLGPPKNTWSDKIPGLNWNPKGLQVRSKDEIEIDQISLNHSFESTSARIGVR